MCSELSIYWVALHFGPVQFSFSSDPSSCPLSLFELVLTSAGVFPLLVVLERRKPKFMRAKLYSGYFLILREM